MKFFISFLLCVYVNVCYAQNLSIPANVHNYKTKQFVCNTIIKLSDEKQATPPHLQLMIESYPGTEQGLGAFFSKEFDATYQTIGNKGGYGWVLSMKGEYWPETDRLYYGLFQGKTANRAYEMYFYKKDINQQLIFRDYFLILSTGDATIFLKYLAEYGFKYFRKLDSIIE